MPGGNFVAGRDVLAAELNDLATLVDTVAIGSVASSVAETEIASATIPAGTAAVGDIFKFRVFGSVDATGTPTLVLRLRLTSITGTTLLTMYNATARASTNEPWYCNIDLLCTAAGGAANFQAAGVFLDRITSNTAASTTQLNNVNSGSADSDVDLPVLISAQWGTSSASNVARSLQGGLYQA